MQDYHKIRVWKRAHALTVQIRRAVQGMPRSGYADLKAQMTSAADSIPMNIVEGSASATQKEFARFLGISLKSCSELQYQLELAHSLGALQEGLSRFLIAEAVEIRKMLFGYRGSVLRAEAVERHDKLPVRSRESTVDSRQPGESRETTVDS